MDLYFSDGNVTNWCKFLLFYGNQTLFIVCLCFTLVRTLILCLNYVEEKIQEIDYQTQLDGESFYHIYVDSDSLIPPNIEKSFRKCKTGKM